MKTFFRGCFSILLIGFTTNLTAEVKLSGYFIARSECPAYQSFRKKTNPGSIKTKVNHAYDLIAKNKQAASHYLIKMDASPNRRWVAISCGEHVVPVDRSVTVIEPPADTTVEPTQHYILAVSWQPGFCETRPSKPECQTQSEDRFDASNFTLHGLWPQPRNNIYCNVAPAVVATDKDRRWGDLAALVLDETTRAELNIVMPGSQSNLHRHEWIKHGTCYNGESAEVYYKDSIRLMNELNASPVRDLFADNIGQEITATQIRDAFDDHFGDGAGDKIKIACKRDGNRRLITEITIALKGDLDELTMGNAMLMAEDANNPGCNKGIVDPVGLQ